MLYKKKSYRKCTMVKAILCWKILTADSVWPKRFQASEIFSDKRIEMVSGFYLAWTLMAYIFLFPIALSSTTENRFSKMCFPLSKGNFNNPIKSLKKYVHYLLWFHIQGIRVINIFYEWNFYVQVSLSACFQRQYTPCLSTD